MKKKILCFLLFAFVQNVFAYTIASQKDSSFSLNDIVFSFAFENSTLEDSSKRYVIFDWRTYEDPSKQNYYWEVQKEEYNDHTNIILWIDNGYFRISYYYRNTNFSDGHSTWRLNYTNDYYDFHNTLVKQMRNFCGSSQTFKKKNGTDYTYEEKMALKYLMDMFYTY